METNLVRKAFRGPQDVAAAIRFLGENDPQLLGFPWIEVGLHLKLTVCT